MNQRRMVILDPSGKIPAEWLPDIPIQVVQGAEGPAGEVGPAGAPGTSVLSGTGPPSAQLGAVGDIYIDTATGDVWKRS